MQSLTRIRLTLRAAIAELPRINYFITTLIAFLGIGVLIYIHYNAGWPTQLINISPGMIAVMLSTIGFFTAFALSASYYTKRLKEVNRAEAFLSVPVSNGERYATGLIYAWVFVPLITYGPLFVLTAMATQFTYGDYLLPALRHLPTVFGEALLIYVMVSTFWIFPAIAFPRRLVIVGIALIGVGVGASLLIAQFLPDPSFTHAVDSSVFSDPSVVGVSEIARYSDEAPTSEIDFSAFRADYGPKLWSLSLVLAIPLFLFAAYRGITLKQA